MRKANPVQRTQSGPLTDSERTQSKPRVNPKRTQIFEKQTQSGPQANSKRTRGPHLGFALVLGWVWSLLYLFHTLENTASEL